MIMTDYLQITLGGMWIGSLYGASAIGLQFILGTTKKVHLAYGHLCIFSGLITVSLLETIECPLYLLIPVIVFFFFFLGWTAHPGSLFTKPKWIRNQRSFLLVSLGFALILEDLGSYIWALPSSKLIRSTMSLRVGPLVIPTLKLYVFALCLTAAISLSLFIKKSLLGKAFRAWETAESEIALVGVNPVGLGKKAMAVGIGFAAFAGAFTALSYPVSIHEGLDMTIKSLCLAVIAGTLSPMNIFGLGLLLGGCESWISMIAGSQWSPVLGYTLFLIILKLRR